MINKKYVNILFFLMVFSLPFTVLPTAIQIPQLGSIGKKLIIFPLLVGFIYTAWMQYKNRDVFYKFSIFKRYTFIYMLSIIISCIVGLVIYPYYSELVSGPLNQSTNLLKVTELLKNIGVNINIEIFTVTWFIIRSLKTLIVDYIFTFGMAFLIYIWYRKASEDGIKVFINAIIISSILILLVGYIEVFYFLGASWAKSILIFLNPIFHDIKANGMWWPPLLWVEQQTRSVFAEPSYLGMFGVLTIPVLLYKFVNSISYKSMFLWGLFINQFLVLLFLTKARTALVLLLFSVLLFILLCLLFYYKDKIILKKLGAFIAIFIVSFFMANYCMAHYQVDNAVVKSATKTQEINVNKYIDDNLTSVTQSNKRSNKARFSIIEADLKIGMDYPILGVGSGLRNRYILDYLPEGAFSNNEVKMWNRLLKEQGIMKFSYPSLSEYAFKFSQTGILGLIIYLFPIYMLGKKLIKKTIKKKDIISIMLTTIFSGILLTGLGDTLVILAAYWIILGLGFAYVDK